MVESNQIVYTYKELATLLVKDRGIHAGFWGIYAKFAFQALNLGRTPSDLLPAAIIPILEIGLQKFDKETNLSVNAAEVNPPAAKRRPRKAEK
jgi:hypothetical protein